MSRSYRHTPVASKRDKAEKRAANRKVRRAKGLFSNKEYRKLYPSYFIGYTFYWDKDNKRKQIGEFKMLIWIIDYDKKVKWPCNDLIVASKWYHYLTDIKGHECSITD